MSPDGMDSAPPYANRAERRRRAEALAAIARARAALRAADQFLAVAAQSGAGVAEVQEERETAEPVTPQEPTRLTRKQLREMGQLGNSPASQSPGQPSRTPLAARTPIANRATNPNRVEFTGVFAQGTEATDYLSWDTTSLPVIARPKRDPLADRPVTQMPAD